jgi:hypothetical protein
MGINSNEFILTVPAKLGDGLYALMVGSWLYKRWGRKIHWVLPRCFGPFLYIEKLLRAQEMTARVTLVDHQIRDFSCGGQPYKFDPATFGIMGEYYNLGFRTYPYCFLPEFYASEYGIGYDPGFVLNIGDHFRSDDRDAPILRSSELAMQMLMPDVETIPTAVDLLYLSRVLAGAREFHSWFCGLAVLCWLANIPATVYRVEGHAPLRLYFPQPRNLKFVELAVHPKDMKPEQQMRFVIYADGSGLVNPPERICQR